MPKHRNIKHKPKLFRAKGLVRRRPVGLTNGRKKFHDRGVAANILKSRYSTDYLIDFTQDKDVVLRQLSDLFKRRLLDVEKHYILCAMPTSILISGNDLSMRSISKQFNVTSQIAEDPGVLFDDLYASLTAYEHLYGDEGSQLEWSISFVFWERKPSDLQNLPGFRGVASLRHATRKLQVRNHSEPLIFGDNRLSILPTECNFDKCRIGEVFNHLGLNFTIDECRDWVVPEKYVGLLAGASEMACVSYRNSSGDALLTFKDYLIETGFVRFVWTPQSAKNPSLYVTRGGKLDYAESPVRDVSYVTKARPKYSLATATYSIYEDRKIGVLDIETYTDSDGNLIPYACGTRIGGPGNYKRHKPEVSMYFSADFDGASPEIRARQIMVAMLKDILLIQNRGYKFYAHNLSGFDGPLIVKYLSHVKGLKIKPLMRGSDTYTIDLSINWGDVDEEW